MKDMQANKSKISKLTHAKKKKKKKKKKHVMLIKIMP